MKNKVLSTIILMMSLFYFNAQAGNISIETAKKAAENYMQGHILSDGLKSLDISEQFTIKVEGENVYYAFNFAQGGFIIISAEDAFNPVIGYNLSGSFDAEGRNENYQSFMQSYKEAILTVRNSKMEASLEIAAKWNELLSSDATRATRDIVVEPLVPSLWNQDDPYNYFCPDDAAGPGGKVYAGCVATTMSQIMYYWRWPWVGEGSNTYFLYPYGTLSANFGDTEYDFNGMVNSCDNFICEPVALLMYHCGIAVDMGYAPDGSGALSGDVPQALANHFKYPNAQYKQKEYYTNTQWINMLKADIDQGYPIYNSGRNSSDGGHAFVCDGYDTDDKFHYNFGWSGSGDGYYTITDVGGFSAGQAIVSNFIPGSGYPNYASGLTEVKQMQGTIEDGSGPVAATQLNADAAWLINPQTEHDSVENITLNFYRFDLGSGDKVSVYDGEDANAPLLGEFTGSTLPSTINSTGNKMYIHFETDGAGNGQGWFAGFTAHQPDYCSGMVILEEPTGKFNDGSGDVFYYKNGTNCKWRIQPEDATTNTLSFNYFKTQEGKDKLTIYDGANNAKLAEYSGIYENGDVPDPVTSESGQFFITFTSNSMINELGWEAEYQIGNISVEENQGIGSLKAWPNPAKQNLNLSFATDINASYEVHMYSVSGQLVYSEQMDNFSGHYKNSIDISQLPAGIYMLKVSGNNQQLNQKVVVE